MGAATRHVEAAADSLWSAFEQLPPPIQDLLVAEVQVLVHAVSGALERVREQSVPVVDATLIHDLKYLADVLHSFEVDLTEIRQGDGEVDRERLARLDQLSAAAAAQVDRVEVAVDRWDDRTRQSLVDLEYADDGGIVVRSVDRSLHGAIRYTALTLLLVGLLVIGLQLLHMAAYRIDRRELLEGRTVLAVTALAVLGLFFVASLALVVFPGALAALSAKVEVKRPEHPCRTLQVQRGQLAGAEAIGNTYLIEGTKRRMHIAAEDCLGLPKEAVASAIGRLTGPHGTVAVASVPTSVVEADVERGVDEPPPQELDEAPRPTASATQAEGSLPQRADAGPDGDAPPAVEEHDVLAELLASIRTSDAAAVEDEADAIDPGDDTAAEDEAAASPTPELFVTTTVVNYREGPSVDAPRLGTLIAGARVNVVSQEGGWSEIRLRDGRSVFVASQFLEPAS